MSDTPERPTIPFGKIPPDAYIRGPRRALQRDEHTLDFTVEERGPTTQEELNQLWQRLSIPTDIAAYRHSQGKPYRRPVSASIGHNTIDVLPELWGLPLSDLVLAYVHALRPSAIRVTRGECTCDSYPWRVTVFVDDKDNVTRIYQEVEVLYSCGAEVADCLRAAKGDRKPPSPRPTVYGNTAGVARTDFI